jgi:hypothetical protein
MYVATGGSMIVAIHKALNQKLGTLQSYRLVGVYVTTGAGRGEMRGTTCELEYEVTYTLHSAEETLLLYKSNSGDYGPDSGDEWGLLELKTISLGLLQ